jgi:16S rRNA processing protein RimM
VSEFLRVGQIVGAFGLKGQVKVLPMTDFLERFQKGARLRLNEGWVEVETFSIHKERPLIKFRGINDIASAEKLQWAYLEVPVPERPELDDDEFLTEDLIGLRVSTVDGIELGKIDDVVAMPAHDVIKIGELLIPAVLEFVKDVDLEAGTMTVKLIPGMID